MTPMYNVIPLLTAAALLTGCGGWVWLDGSSVDSKSLQAAQQQCGLAEKEAQLETYEIEREQYLEGANNEAEKREINEAYDRRERLIKTEVRTCMRKIGLKPR